MTSGFIKLRNPFPCELGKSLRGNVVGLRPGALLVDFDARTLPEHGGELDLFVPTAKVPLQVPVEFFEQNEHNLFTLNVVSEIARSQLHDLLAAVRKGDHIDICAQMDVEASDRFTGFADWSFLPKALPNMAMAEVDTRQTFLGQEFSLPLLITGMTGGIERGELINERLADAAQSFGIPMGVGSQRLAIENPAHEKIFKVRKTAPNLFLIANLGLAQLAEKNYLEWCQRAVHMIEANALALHLNVLQEIIQIEGDKDFRYLLDKLHILVEKLGVPLIIKEVGAGMDPQSLSALLAAGVAAVDVGGRGGTSWGYIEGVRARCSITRALGEEFRDWGIPTAYALTQGRQKFSTACLIATGGIRDGQTVAKAVALGADMVGVGLPLLKSALKSSDQLWDTLERFKRGLATTMLCTESRTLAELKRRLVHQPIPFREHAWNSSTKEI